MQHQLRFHRAIIELLGVNPVVLQSRVDAINEREDFCKVSFPASVKEWFSLEGAESFFHDNTTPDDLTELNELGDPAETAQGYLKVATENQAVVAWFVRLNDGDDPAVYDNNNEFNDDLSKTNWRRDSETFTNFIFDMISNGFFGGWEIGMHLEAKDVFPSPEMLSALQDSFRPGPETDRSESKVVRFFNRHGLLTIASTAESDRKKSMAEWRIEADSPDALYEITKRIWCFGTLKRTLKAQSSTPETRADGDKILQRLRLEDSKV